MTTSGGSSAADDPMITSSGFSAADQAIKIDLHSAADASRRRFS